MGCETIDQTGPFAARAHRESHIVDLAKSVGPHRFMAGVETGIRLAFEHPGAADQLHAEIKAMRARLGGIDAPGHAIAHIAGVPCNLEEH